MGMLSTFNSSDTGQCFLLLVATFDPIIIIMEMELSGIDIYWDIRYQSYVQLMNLDYGFMVSDALFRHILEVIVLLGYAFLVCSYVFFAFLNNGSF